MKNRKRLLSVVLLFSLMGSLLSCNKAAPGNVVIADVKKQEEKVERELEGLDQELTGMEETALTEFALNMLRKNMEEDENVFLSPVSITTALAMTGNGAKEKTLQEMEEVLGVSVPLLNKYLRAYMDALPNEDGCKLKMGNAIWFKETPDFAVKQDFLQQNADYYDAEINSAVFDADTVKQINDWVKTETDGMIPNIIEEMDKDAVMYLINAMALDAEWDVIYEKNDIREGRFTFENEEWIPFSFMYSEESTYLEDEKAEGILKYYKGLNCAFVGILPKKGTIKEYVNGLTGEELQSLLENMQGEVIKAGIPQFEVEYSKELSETLKALGMKDAFTPDEADFTGISENDKGEIYINKVFHKTYVKLDGKGTKAGAATAVEMAKTTALPFEPQKEIYLNRPFLYMIIDAEKNLPLFLGVMQNPEGK